MRIRQSSRTFCVGNLLKVVFFLLALSELRCFAATPRQIFPQSNQVMSSRLLGASGVAAYIVSSQGTNRGLLINQVTPSSVAARIGIAEGDVLLNLNNHVVDSASQADRILSDAPSGTLHCVFVRQGSNGLQLYNQAIVFTNISPGGSGSGTSRAARPNAGFRAEQVRADQIKESIPKIESYVVEVVNADRRQFGLAPLQVHSAIGGVARAFAQDMAARGFKNHIDPEGRDPTARGKSQGLNIQLGENFGWSSGVSFTDGVNRINNDMMSEPPNDPTNHRGNILNPKYIAIGCGAAYSPRTGELIVVEDFAEANP
jgi:uncharacterized protein YkwD